MNNNLKIVYTTLFMIITLITLILSENIIKGYEISIYTQINPIVWILVIITLIGGITLLTWDLQNEKQYWWKLSILLIMIINTIIIFLPVMIGYQFSISGDTLSHLGYILAISNNGHISNDIYPINHLIISIITAVSSISSEDVIKYFGIIYYSLFILFSYLMAKRVFKKNKIAILACLFSTIPFFYFYYAFIPIGFTIVSFIMFYYIYFIYQEKKSANMGILILLLLLFMVLMHPVASFFLLISLIFFELGKVLYLKRYSHGEFRLTKSLNKISITFSLILTILFVSWLWQGYGVWEAFVHGIIDLFSNELNNSGLTTTAAESFGLLNFSILDMITLFIKMYGHIFILGLVGIIAAMIIILNKKNEKIDNKQYQSLFILSIIFVTFSVLAIIDFIQPLSILSSGRLMFLPMIFIPLFSSFGLYFFIKKYKADSSNKLIKIALISFLSIPFLIAIFSLHQSPFVYKSNPAVTSEEITGADWIIVNGNIKMNTISLGVDDLKRFSDAIYSRKKMKYSTTTKIKIPDHFNYTQGEPSNLGQDYDKNYYLITRKDYILSLYRIIFPQLNRFTEEDFRLLNEDNTVYKIYENGEVQNWHIIGNNTS